MNLNLKATVQPPVPAGRYRSQITEVRVRNRQGQPLLSQAGNYQASLEHTLLTDSDDPSAATTIGRKVFDNLTLTTPALWRFADYYKAAKGLSNDDLPEGKDVEDMSDDEKMKELLEADPNAVKFESVDDGMVLTASPKELQKFVLKYADDERLFPEEIELVRKKTTDSNKAGKKND